MDSLETYTSALAALSATLLLIASGLVKKQLVWKRRALLRARYPRRRS
jgi:hypothetical protein